MSEIFSTVFNSRNLTISSLHFNLKHFFEHFLQGRSSCNELPQLFIWECLNFSFILEEEFCQILNSQLTGFFFQLFKCIISLPSGIPYIWGVACVLLPSRFSLSLFFFFKILFFVFGFFTIHLDLGLFRFILLGIGWTWIQRSLSFLKFEKYSGIISSNNLSFLFYLSSSGTHTYFSFWWHF